MVYWLIDTAGIGSLVVFVVAISVFIAYFRMLRWIQTTLPPQDDQPSEAETIGEKTP